MIGEGCALGFGFSLDVAKRRVADGLSAKSSRDRFYSQVCIRGRVYSVKIVIRHASIVRPDSADFSARGSTVRRLQDVGHRPRTGAVRAATLHGGEDRHDGNVTAYGLV